MCDKEHKCPVVQALEGIKQNGELVVVSTEGMTGKCNEHYDKFVQGLEKKGNVVLIYTNQPLHQAAGGPV
jgi:hypothetical protein